MKIFNKKGYCNIPGILSLGAPFNFVVGARGTGKTYTSLLYAIEHKVEFIFMRRTQAQVDIIGRKEFSPFKKLEHDLGIEIECKKISQYTTGFYMNDELIGIAVALSTFSNLRGFSSMAELLIYDEFIPERHERPIKDEGAAFLNCIETINRNRELEGNKPITVLCLANSNDIGNPLFMELDLINIAEKLKRSDKLYYWNHERGLVLVDLKDSPISEKKKETALYKLVKDSQFKKMAIENEFIDDTIAIIQSKSLKEYTPLVTIADVTIYEHKSEKLFYVSEHYSGTPERFSTASADITQFRRKYYYLWSYYLGKKIIFENKLCSVVFEKLW